MTARMLNRRAWLAGAGAALLSGAGCRTTAPVDAAPRFHGKTLDGERFDNESLKGKVVLIQFWATWCGYCRRDQEAVDAIATALAEKGVVVLAVNAGETRSKVKEYLAGSPRASRVVLTEDTNLVEVFGAQSFPLYYVIGREGNVSGEQKGAGGAEPLVRLLVKAGVRAG